MRNTSRRAFLTAAAGLVGGGLAATRAAAQLVVNEVDAADIYGAVDAGAFRMPAVDLRRIDPDFLRAVVDYPTDQPVGSIVIDPEAHYLYYVRPGGQAIRYGVGVGRQGFVWSGSAEIKAKREWPDWYPPKEMIARDPHVRGVMQQLQSGMGMPGGPGNPLGARAMYLYQGNKDTLFRIHGTVEPWSIGHSVSSGCIRMINQDVFDLYNRVPMGTHVLVLGHDQPSQVAEHTMRKPDVDDGSTYVTDDNGPQPDMSGMTQPYGNDPYATYAPDAQGRY